MCGIAGIVNLDGSPVDPELLLRMRDSMVHRGPDDAGLWTEGPVGLAHRRLSILDLSPQGHQPMVSDDGAAWIVFNGEIFNFVEIRGRLEGLGHTFHSTSDTEVLLKAWQEAGESCLAELVGMFGFAIWDRDTRSLFAARDRAGIKPFYHATVGNAFIFASEIKALLEHPALTPHLDPVGFSQYHSAGYTLEDRTLFEGVRQLPPGHLLELRDGRVTTRPYWGVEYRYDRRRNHADTAAEVTSLLENAIEIHCRSDAPLGGHLSGGLDSSTVVTLARPHREPFHTFSIRFSDGGVYDESAYARAVAERVGSVHHEDKPGAVDLRDLLPFLIWHMDVPMSRSAFSYFSGARLARRHVTVSLTGHGGDEIFGGYPAQFALAFGAGGTELSASPTLAEPGAARRLVRMLRREGVRGIADRIRRRAESASEISPAEQWLRLHCTRPDAAGNPAFAAGFRGSLQGYSPETDYLRHFVEAPTDELFDRCLHHDLRSYLPSLLHAEDRASMAISLESRVPLLDHRLIEFLATVPPETKSPTRQSKELVRTVMKDRLPPQVLDRTDKGAFPVPVREWFQGSLMDYALEILMDPRTLDRGIYDPDRIRSVTPDDPEVWSMLTLELWARLFLDRDAELLAQVDRVREGLTVSGGV